MPLQHIVEYEGAPIADAVVAKCSCGWRKSVSFWDHDDAWTEAKQQGDNHIHDWTVKIRVNM